MKKKLALFLTLFMVVAVTGCGKSSDSGDATPTPSATLAPGAPDPPALPKEEDGAPSESTHTVSEEPGLKDVFSEHNMKAGTCLTAQMISNVQTSKILLSQFNSVTMENAMKPDSILSKTKSAKSGELVVELNKDMIKMLNWAKANNMAVRGHTFVWYSQTPEWIFHEDFDTRKDLVNREVMLSRMESMIRQMFELLEEKEYLDLFYAYDIVNEAWMEDGTKRENKWLSIIGEDYLWYAFYYADKYAPEHVDLYYNDYNEQYKTNALLKFVDTLVDEDGSYLIDGIGLQAHLYTSDDMNGYFRMLDQLAETGLKIELTELDICLGSWQNPKEASEDNLKAQGRYYYNLINGILERVDAGTLNMDALTFWGFSDGLSWRKEYSPLLYDRTYAPKYAYYGALQQKELAGFTNE